MEVNLLGDSAETLRALIPYLQRKMDRKWREKIEKEVSDWWQIVEARAKERAEPLNPELVFLELSNRLPAHAILTADAGTTANWYGRIVRMKQGNMGSLSGGLASMGAAVPYAIAAKFAYPDRLPICCTGDGAMQMNGLNELITVAKYWKQWRNPGLIFLVLNNRDLNQVTWEMRILAGNPKLEATQSLPDFPYARFAETIGLRGIRVNKPEDVGKAWDAALAATSPVVFEAYVTGEVPTLPPHISFEQAKNFVSALMRGDPEESGIIKHATKELIGGILPSKDKG